MTAPTPPRPALLRLLAAINALPPRDAVAELGLDDLAPDVVTELLDARDRTIR